MVTTATQRVPTAPDASSFAVGVYQAIAVFRFAAWTWMALAAVAARDHMRAPWTAAALLGVALAVTIAAWRDRAGDGSWKLPVIEVAVGAALLAGDSWVYLEGRPLTLGSAWPLAGPVIIGMRWSRRWGALAGATLGAGHIFGVAVLRPLADREIGSIWPSLSTMVLFVLAGWLGGYLVGRLRWAEEQVSTAKAREEVARTLHDGVLQTLAMVQRRANDPDLAALAAEQERDLRSFLFDVHHSAEVADLHHELTAVVANFERQTGLSASVIVADDLGHIGATSTAALVGAVREALANTAKHAEATKANIFVEPADDEMVFCSVKDDGRGFDDATTSEGRGLRDSIGNRIAEVGGRSEVRGRPGRGTEVQLWVPNG